MVGQVAFAAPSPGGFLLEALAARSDFVAGELDYVEGVHDGYRAGQHFPHGGLEPGESVHGHGFDVESELDAAGLQPGFQHLFGSAWDHV